MTELLPATRAALFRRVAREQYNGRAPSLVAGVVRAGELAWTGGRGSTGVVGGAPGADTQYRIGSVTKTFTAALVMQLRDAGRLRLTDTVDDHLPGTAVGDRRIAALLAHTAGVGAETAPPWWERTDGTARSLADVLGTDPAPLREGEAYHYSNLGYGVLGEVIAAITGTSWREAVRERLISPLGLERTTLRPVAPHANGLAVHPWADLVLTEPEEDAGMLAPAGQLWSTVADLATWAELLAGARPDVLAAATAAEMAGLATVSDDRTGWVGGHGLGLQLFRNGSRRLAGHTGSMPGFVATLWLSPDDGLAAMAMANATAGPAISRLVADLIELVAVAEPVEPDVWEPRSASDPHLLALVGPWYWGPTPFALRLMSGHDVELVALLGTGRQARFTPAGPDMWTGVDGYYRGETLRAVRGPGAEVTHLELASFVFTRAPYAPEAPVPGGVDGAGWHTGQPGPA